MEAKDLNKILEEHKLWLSGNEEAKRANLHGANLRSTDLYGADLYGADLRRADLYGADLRGAVLCGADLRGADLRGADLYCADLYGADLHGADLRGADLRSADLHGADLYGADLHGADLRCADLRGANLHGANLRSTDLYSANLHGANLYSANLHGAENVPFITMLIPEGECIVWKKIECYIIKLKLLEDSKRSRATTEKCRCDKALVLEIQNIDGTPSGLSEIENNNFAPITYKVGDTVYADSWDEDRWNECSHGIHFFIDRQSAVNY